MCRVPLSLLKEHDDEIIGAMKEDKEEEPEGEVLGDDSTGNLICSPFHPLLLTEQFYTSVSL